MFEGSVKAGDALRPCLQTGWNSLGCKGYLSWSGRTKEVLKQLPQRVCCSQQCAMSVQHMRVPEQAQGSTSPKKNSCDKQVSSWRHISCHTDKNRYYT